MLETLAIGPPAATIGPTEAHLWTVHLDCQGDAADWLDHDERERAARFRFERDRRRWITARTALRGILSQYCGRSPEALRFGATPHGKPFLIGDDGAAMALRFNLSHSEGLALVAVAASEIGVDVEYAGRTIDWTALTGEVFTVREREVLLGRNPLTALQLWTLKEAYMKGRGLGLTLPLQRFEVIGTPSSAVFRVAVAPDWHDGGDWWLYCVETDTGYAAALASALPLRCLSRGLWVEREGMAASGPPSDRCG